MLLTKVEAEVIEEKRRVERELKPLHDAFARARIRQAELIASPPPPGFPYRCRHCGAGTHASDRVCAVCWVY
jgi:hypothetical protein